VAYPFEIAIDSGAAEGEISVRVLSSLTGGEPGVVARLDVTALVAVCESLESAVLDSVGVDGAQSRGEALLQSVGQQLFDAVFSGDVGTAYRSSYAVARDRNDKLRLVLRLSDARLASLPWEAMYDARNDEYVCRNEPLVRYVAAGSVPIPLALKPPLRILGLVSSPSDMPPLAVEEEKARLTDALAGLVVKGLVYLDWVDRPDWDSVHAKLRDDTWHVLHFIGHGEYDNTAQEGTIALVGADGRSHMVDADRFADLLNQGGSQPRLVVLNSCQSGRTGTRDVFSSCAATLVRRGTSAVAAMQFTVSDASAVTFARGFYDSLAKGDTVDQAVQSGRVSMLGGGSLEWVTPVIYVRGDTSQLFDITPPPARTPTPSPSPSPSPPIVDDRVVHGGRWNRRRVWLGAVLTSAIVIPLVAWIASSAGHWFIGKVNPEEHLSAVVSIPPLEYSCGTGEAGWVFDQKPSELPGVMPDDDKEAWAAAHGGIPASGNYYVVTLQGLNGHTVVVNGISVDVVSRAEPPRGTYPYTGGQCGGLVPYRFALDLDKNPVSVAAVADDGVVAPGEERRPVDLPHAISGSEPEVWHLAAVTTECDCEWTATLNWTSDGVEGHTKIDNHGKPFRTAATAHAIEASTDYKGGWDCYENSAWRKCSEG
jgi:CHAT domain